jgi:hypothetical protein
MSLNFNSLSCGQTYGYPVAGLCINADIQNFRFLFRSYHVNIQGLSSPYPQSK